MSRVSADVPDVVVKPGKMILQNFQWSRGICTAIAFVAIVVLYTYVLLLVKSLYMRDEWLDKIAIVIEDTDHMIQSIKSLDQQLAADIERLA